MKKYIIILFAVLALGVSKGMAQENTIWELEWNISFPMGEMKDMFNENSLRGIEFGGTYRFETNVTVGGTMAYSAFFSKSDPITVYWENKALTAVHMRDLYSYSFMAEGGYAYKSDFPVTPYFKVGIGGFWTEQYTTIGLLYWSDRNWDFGMRPELGFYYIPEYFGLGFIANVKYNWIPSYKNQGMEKLSYLTLGLGIVFEF
ncbi:MAG: outer membrane beta-barrel protein [Bacteroidota bacterium]|nr:outer membrane beta-barrel protein [Bacteroidota bacterium]